MGIEAIAFRGFWKGFQPEDFFMPMIRGSAPGHAVRLVRPDRADLIIDSVFRPRQQLHRALWRRPRALRVPSVAQRKDPRLIWYSGENQRPPFKGYDLAFSFDPDSVALRNVYFPLWFQLFRELVNPKASGAGAMDRLGIPLHLEDVMGMRASDIRQRRRFACAFLSNPEPMRMHVIEALRVLGPVDIFGAVSGRAVPFKWPLGRHYQFIICFENDIYPGYVTEKVFEAWGCGAIPIYNGMDTHGYLNPAAIVNLNDHGNVDGLVREVARLRQDLDASTHMAEQPLLLRRPDLCLAQSRISEVFQGLLAGSSGGDSTVGP